MEKKEIWQFEKMTRFRKPWKLKCPDLTPHTSIDSIDFLADVPKSIYIFVKGFGGRGLCRLLRQNSTLALLGRPSENQEEAGRKNFHLDSSGGDQTRTRRGRAAILYRNPL